MARFRRNYQRSGGAGFWRMIIWVVAMVSMLGFLFYWMHHLHDLLHPGASQQ
ncbi:MAG: hypothetical protein J5I41_00070 [Saprospiraceae bacterium]|nr:hypothetical protein [Saprospiraceae bacterium]